MTDTPAIVLIDFFYTVRAAKPKVSVKEHLTLLLGIHLLPARASGLDISSGNAIGGALGLSLALLIACSVRKRGWLRALVFVPLGLLLPVVIGTILGRAQDEFASPLHEQARFNRNPLKVALCEQNAPELQPLLDNATPHELARALRECSHRLSNSGGLLFGAAIAPLDRLRLQGDDTLYCEVLAAVHRRQELPLLRELSRTGRPIDCAARGAREPVWWAGVSRDPSYGTEREWLDLLKEQRIDLGVRHVSPIIASSGCLLDKVIERGSAALIRAALDAGCDPQQRPDTATRSPVERWAIRRTEPRPSWLEAADVDALTARLGEPTEAQINSPLGPPPR